MASKTIVFLSCLLLGNIVSCLDGPVFINQDIAAQIATPVAKNENLQTQTVYGFLDFTTTIGNTVMIFSPQSAAAAVTEKTKDVSSNTIIDTKPQEVKKEVVNIKPSKPQAVSEKTEVAQKITSVVQVNPDPPQKHSAPKFSSKIEVKSTPATKVNVIEGKSAPKHKPPPIIVSKVEVIEETKPTVSQSIITKVEVVTEATAKPVIASKVEVISEEKPTETVVHSVVQVKSDDEPAAIVGNNIGEPEYDFLHRQPSEVVEETYKVINLRPSSKFHLKPRATADAKIRPSKKSEKDANPHPTGLVSKMEGMVVHDGVMTSYETSVIGTYINGKYAQVLQSTSHVYNQPKDSNNQGKAKIAPTQTLRILKTAAPSLKVNKNRQHLDPTPATSLNEDVSIAAADAFNAQNSIKTTRKPAKRFKNRQKEVEPAEQKNEKEAVTSQATFKKSTKNRTSSSRNSKQHSSSSQRRSKSGREGRKSKSSKTTTTHPSAYSEEPTPAPSVKRFSGGRKKPNARASIVSNEDKNNAGFSRRGYKPKVQASTVELNSASTSLYKFKLNRSPGRWQYKTTSKPRVTIRKQNEDDDITNNNEALETTSSSKPDIAQQNKDVVTPQARSDDVDSLEGSESIATIIDDDSATENKVDVPTLPLETLKVEISTPPDFKDVYYEIATIKSPYTFQVGSVKNTRYITVTSTFEKHLENIEPTHTLAATEPLTENILATTSNYAKDNNLDSSIATLPPIYLASDVATPPLETLTETFSTIQTVLKTHILPVIRSVNDTTSSTLVQTYIITRLVTATKTLPPMEAYHFNPSKTLNEFNSRLDEAGSELHLELEFGDSNEQEEDGLPRKILPADLDLANIGTDFRLPETDKAKIEQELKNRKVQQQKHQSSNDIPQQNLSQDQLQQLALLRLLNPGAPQGQVITTSRPIIKLETIYETHVLPVTQGHNTILSTISKVKGTLTKTEYEFGTSTITPSYPQAIPQIQQIPQIPQIPQLPPINPLFPQPQPQFTVTSSAVTHNTVVTQTNSKILKLTFGARTALTTVFSTTLIPTVVTSYMTASVPFVAQTAAFPGYFPAPYPAYPYVG